MDDSEIVERIKAGDPLAWSDLVGKYERLVYAIPTRMGLEPADVEEVFQNSWILLHAHITQLRDVQRLRSWISTTARRECWRIQRRTRESVDVEGLGLLASGSDPTASIEQVELRDAIAEGLGTLRKPCAKLLNLLFFGEDRPQYAAVARELNLPVGSLGPTRARCLADLAKYLEDQGF